MKRILLVADKIIPVFTVKKYLERMGHQLVEVVNDAQAALVAVRQGRPDVILVDINVTSPLFGTETDLTTGEYCSIPVIYAVSCPSPLTLESISQTRNAILIEKPLTEENLRDAIGKCNQGLTASSKWLVN